MKYSLSASIIMLLLITSCIPSPDRLKSKKTNSTAIPEQGCYILFYEIDDYVQIKLNGKLISDTQDFKNKQGDELLIELKGIRPNTSNNISINVFNKQCVSCSVNSWTATYSLYKNGQELEYVSESSTGQAEIGHVFTKKHTL